MCKNEQTINNIEKTLKEYFPRDYIRTLPRYYENNKTDKPHYYMLIQSQFTNPSHDELNDFKNLIDKKLQEILQNEPNIFTNKSWEYISNRTTNGIVK